MSTKLSGTKQIIVKQKIKDRIWKILNLKIKL